MFNAIIAFSLKNRLLIVALALLVAGLGGYATSQVPIDVFPDLTRPTVTIMTEFTGRAPEEVEQLVTFPLEAAVNGATGVERVRSATSVGLSVVDVEFDWRVPVQTAQQVVTQRLNAATLPDDAKPVLMPASSFMGEMLLIGLESTTGASSPMELRTLADWTIRPRLLAIPGVSQVRVMGGLLKQYHVVTDPGRLALQEVTLEDLERAVAAVVPKPAGGGIVIQRGLETNVRIIATATRLEDLADAIVVQRPTGAVRIRDVATVSLGHPQPRGDGAVRVRETTADGKTQLRGGAAVILDVDKQPGANTVALDEQIHAILAEMQTELAKTHPDVKFQTSIFRQANFIQTAITNVWEAVRDGILFLAVVLFLFLWNVRTAIITLLVLPLPLLLLGLLFAFFGVSINTMTLGGIAIAIGDLVDDSIVDIENIHRRLREWRQGGTAGPTLFGSNGPLPLHPESGPRFATPVLKQVFEASAEVRNSIVYATLIVCVTVTPLFFLAGLEGRMFTPMGLAYVVTLLASLLVSLTITPVLASYLLPRARSARLQRDSFLVRFLKWLARPIILTTLRHPRIVLAATGLMVLASLLTLPFMGGQFLPRFNEGTLTITLFAAPGTSLQETNRLVSNAESILFEIPEVMALARRTGRAELDEHAEGVNVSDVEVLLRPQRIPRSGRWAEILREIPFVSTFGWEHTSSRTVDEIMEDVRHRLEPFEEVGVEVEVGQPISHRMDHVMSGVQAEVAIKLSGPDLTTLRSLAHEVADVLEEMDANRAQPRIADLRVEAMEELEQIRIAVKPEVAASFGRSVAEVNNLMETALRGRVVGQVLDQQRVFDVVLWFDVAARSDLAVIRDTLVDTPLGRVPLRQLADVEMASGPITINREAGQRRIVVSCNVAGGDLTGTVQEMQRAIRAHVEIPAGYGISFGGQFEAQQRATWRLWIFFPLALLCVFFLLWKAVESWRAALQVLVNVPLALFGSVVALFLSQPPSSAALAVAAWYEWPAVWIGQINLSLAHWIGFITLTGIVTRNGIMMITHYLHLMRYEGESFGEQMVLRGTLERLTPVLMTAITSIVGLLPLLLGAGETGKEILHPLAVVVTGGMISSTLLDQLVTPALFLTFGRKTFGSPTTASTTIPSEKADGALASKGRH